MYDLDVVSDVVPDVVPHLNGLPSKQLKARIRYGGAANYGPRITEYIAEYYRVFNATHLLFAKSTPDAPFVGQNQNALSETELINCQKVTHMKNNV